MNQQNQTFSEIPASKEETVDIGRYVGVLLSRWWLILLGPLVAGIVAWVYSERQTPIYEAATTIQVQEGQGTSGITSLGDIQTSRSLAVTYKELIKTRPVMQGVIDEMKLDMSPNALEGKISVTLISGTELLRIQVNDSDPEQAALIADTVAQIFKQQTEESRLADIARLQRIAVGQGVSNVQDFVTAQLNALGSILVVETAEAPPAPISPNKRLNVLLAVVLGLIFAGLLAFVLEYLQDTVQTPDRVERRFGLVSLGAVPEWRVKELPERQLLMEKMPKSHYAEAVRNLRANIQFVNAANATHVMAISSPWQGEGKSTVVANIATAFAQEGKSVIVVDTDFRRPSLNKLFGLDRTMGLTNFLAFPEVSLNDVIQETHIKGVKLISSGPIPPNPSEMLGAPRMKELLVELKEKANLVLFDCPPLVGMSDSIRLGAMTGGLILVVTPHTSMEMVNKVLESMRIAKVNVMGFVVNKFSIGRFRYGYYKSKYYHYYYSQYYASEDGARTNGSLLKSPIKMLKEVLGGPSKTKK